MVPGMGHDLMAPAFEVIPVIKIAHQFRADPFVHTLETGQMAGGDYVEAGFEAIGFMYFCNPVKRFFKAVVETEAKDMRFFPGRKMIEIEAQGGKGGGLEEGPSEHGSDVCALNGEYNSLFKGKETRRVKVDEGE